MRPLDHLGSIKLKLGVVIVAAISVTSFVVVTFHHFGIHHGLSVAIAILLGLAMVQLLARGMTSPLREMARATNAMAAGDYERRVTATSRDEVGELARAFNRMAGELAEVDRLRRDLIANVSHELRTPIGALQAVLENVVDGVVAPDPRVLAAMLSQVQRLGRLVTQLLDLSRLESGALLLERERFPVGPLLDEAVIGAFLDGRDLHLAIDVDPADLVIDGDPERLHQVVANLVDNAIQHSPAGGTITISAHQRDAHVAIAVADEGPGVPEDQTARIFERFYRADAARSTGGAGLGLAICRWIVDLHGGAIRVEPVAPHGCRMVVELPA